MNSITNRMTGINTWFIIEIISFYGYILSAVFYIMEHSLRSALGHKKRERRGMPMFKYDFMQYVRKDLDWAAFVQVLFNVNVCLILLD